MATYNTTNLVTGVIGGKLHTTPGDAQENGAGVFYIGSSQSVIYVKPDGGDQIIIITQVPVIRRSFDSGFQFS